MLEDGIKNIDSQLHLISIILFNFNQAIGSSNEIKFVIGSLFLGNCSNCYISKLTRDKSAADSNKKRAAERGCLEAGL